MIRFFHYFIILICFFTSIGTAKNSADNIDGWKISNNNTQAKASVETEGTLCISGEVGDGQIFFTSAPMPMKPSTFYALDFSASGNTSGGCILSGTLAANSDTRINETSWNKCEVLFATPANPSNRDTTIKLGAWRTSSEIKFKDVSVFEYIPLLANKLGEQESVQNGVYTFVSGWDLNGCATTPMATLENAPFFNTNRWSLSNDVSVAYRLGVRGAKQTSGEIECGITYNPSKMGIEVMVSTKGKPYETIGVLSQESSSAIKVPEKFFPTEKIKVKFVGRAMEKNGTIQISNFKYTANLENKSMRANGNLVGAARASLSDSVSIDKKSWKPTSSEVCILIDSQIDESIPISFSAITRDGEKIQNNLKFDLKNGQNRIPVKLPAALKEIENFSISIQPKEWSITYKSKPENIGLLRRDKSGKCLTTNLPNIALWQSTTSNKLARECETPKGAAQAIKLNCAANELESAQLVFKGEHSAKIKLSVSNLQKTDDPSAKIGAENIELFLVDYVPISTLTDKWGERNDWPDALPRLVENSFEIEGDKIQPIWLTIAVAKNTSAGIYKGSLTVEVDGKKSDVPVEIEVFDFALPDATTVRTAFGDSATHLPKYYLNPQKAKSDVHKQVIDKLARARISPYYRQYTRPSFKLEFPDNDKTKTPKVVFNWKNFDEKVESVIRERCANSLVLNIEGIGSGTFHARHSAKIGEIPESDPRYEAVLSDYLGQINAHILEKGWQNIFYTYTFDEPEKKDYPFVAKELGKIKRFAPNLKVMLTEEPSNELFGMPNIWCMLTDNFNEQACRERAEKGDEIWWYICTQPRAPFAGEFIDHPGIDLRVWLWQTFKYNVKGILVWATAYMHSYTAYPNSLQNPYHDPMSWADGQGLADGAKSSWGNGDGRFFYPPISYKNSELAADNAEIVGTTRLEILREGIEDFEYLSILKRLLTEKEKMISPQERSEIESLLKIPETITRTMTDYSFDEKYIQEHRLKVARAIEKLNKKTLK